MSGPRFENSWSIGNIITLLTMIVGGVTVVTQLQNEAEMSRLGIERVERSMLVITETTIGQEIRIRALELGAGRSDEKMTNILATVSRIEANQDVIRRRSTGDEP